MINEKLMTRLLNICSKAKGTVYELKLDFILNTTEMIVNHQQGKEALDEFHQTYTYNFTNLYELLFLPEHIVAEYINENSYHWYFYTNGNGKAAVFCVCANHSSATQAFVKYVQDKNPTTTIEYYAGFDIEGHAVFKTDLGFKTYIDVVGIPDRTVFRDVSDRATGELADECLLFQYAEQYIKKYKPRYISDGFLDCLYNQFLVVLKATGNEFLVKDHEFLSNYPAFITFAKSYLLTHGFWTKQSFVERFRNTKTEKDIEEISRHFAISLKTMPTLPNFPAYIPYKKKTAMNGQHTLIP